MSNGNEGVLCIPQISSITGTSPSDCLVSYPEHSLVGRSYPSAKVQPQLTGQKALQIYIWFRELISIYCRLFVLILVVFCVVSSFTTFQPNFTSGLLQVILLRPRIGMLSLVTISPVNTAFHSCCLSHHVFDQVNLWPAWVGFETAVFWQCSPGNVETQRLYPLHHGPRRAIKDGYFGLINPYLVFQSRVRTEFILYLSLIGIILRWGFLIWELIFIYCGLFVLILVPVV